MNGYRLLFAAMAACICSQASAQTDAITGAGKPWEKYQSTESDPYAGIASESGSKAADSDISFDDLIPKNAASMTRIDLLLEAERRGILPQDKLELLQEARRRGLVPARMASDEPRKPVSDSDLIAQLEKKASPPPLRQDYITSEQHKEYAPQLTPQQLEERDRHLRNAIGLTEQLEVMVDQLVVSKKMQCVNSVGNLKFCTCIANESPPFVSFIGYVMATANTNEELHYSSLKPDARREIDNSRAARVKCLGLATFN